jgi:tRNA nucleotidyltransferase (CCA-adding enzyme)
MNPDVIRLCEAVRDAGGRAMLVGGSVRDQLLNIESKDFDIEVYGLQPDRLRKVLEQIGPVNAVGGNFAVYKLVFYKPEPDQSVSSNIEPAQESERPGQRFEVDVSLPRRESKTGRGHRGFVIEGDPLMSVKEAALRRDFTINAILLDPLTGKKEDPYRGEEDLSQRILRVVSPETFVEDSLRVLRAVQLAARFEMTIDPATIALCRTIDLSDLPHERIWGEFEKLLTLSNRPSIGLGAALELQVLEKLFPEFLALISDPGSSNDLFLRTKRALDQAVHLTVSLSQPKRIAVMLAVLCHELEWAGGPAATEQDADNKVDPRLTRRVLNRLGLYTIGGYDVRAQVFSLVRENRKPEDFNRGRQSTTDGDIRRLSQRVEIDLLYRVEKAWALGGRASTAAADWLIERAAALGVRNVPPAPLLLGRHLIEAGIEPGPEIGKLLHYVYEMQLDGKITTTEEALAAARTKRQVETTKT